MTDVRRTILSSYVDDIEYRVIDARDSDPYTFDLPEETAERWQATHKAWHEAQDEMRKLYNARTDVIAAQQKRDRLTRALERAQRELDERDKEHP